MISGDIRARQRENMQLERLRHLISSHLIPKRKDYYIANIWELRCTTTESAEKSAAAVQGLFREMDGNKQV